MRQQRGDRQRGQVVGQFDPADFKDHQRHNAGDEAGGEAA